MKVLVDTSVWSVSLRRSHDRLEPAAAQLTDLISAGEQIVVLGVILQEILQGVKETKQFIRLRNALDAFPLLSLERTDYESAAQLYSKCRSAGIQAGTVDCLIATASINYDCKLFTLDQDFQHIARVSRLQLV